MNTNDTKEIAVANMVKLGMLPQCIMEFRKDANNIWCSECQPSDSERIPNKVAGLLYKITNGYFFQKEAAEAIAKVREAGFIPYHVIQTKSSWGNLFTVLFVTQDGEGLLTDEDFYDEEHGYCAPSYVYNATNNDLSEFGSVYIKSSAGGLIRTA